MTTTVTGQVIRARLTLDAFADITGPEVRIVPPIRADGITFDADLSAEQVAAIRDRMTSRDDTDQAERARIAAALDGGATNLPQMLAERELGRPVREPIYPQ